MYDPKSCDGMHRKCKPGSGCEHFPNKPTHTPGPWKREGDDIIGERYICELSDWALVGMGTKYDEQERALKAERDANARLIAAAPDLLAALKAIKEGVFIAQDAFSSRALEAVDAAIRRATEGK